MCTSSTLKVIVQFVPQEKCKISRTALTPNRSFASFFLIQESGSYLPSLIKPVIACFSDPDSRTRYYACEALYNIVKIARSAVLQHFNTIFNVLSKVGLRNLSIFLFYMQYEAVYSLQCYLATTLIQYSMD